MNETYALPQIGVLEVLGPEAGKFLQGQLSNDVLRLTVGAAQLTALHTVQGRVQALLRLLRTAEQDYLALLPRALIADVLATLRKRVFRARVTLSDASDRWSVAGALAPPANKPHAPVDASGRCLVLEAPGAAAAGSEAAWRRLDIRAGLPQVYPATQGEFVAQMLNLDVLGGIAFDKGCYIGQEIIARAHYRGRVKRRMQRFAAPATPPLSPGDSLTLPDGSVARVVDSAQVDSGQEVLAVTETGAAGALALPYDLPVA